MDNDFSTRIKGKSKDDLVRIILNTEEYNSEFVAAAEKELRIRMDEGSSETTPKPVLNRLPTTPSANTLIGEDRETPFGVYFAGILLILSALFWISVASLQVGVGSIIGEGLMKGIGVWNIFMAIAQAVIAIGVFTRKRWGLDWGMGTGILDLIWFGYYYIESNAIIFLITSLVGGLTFLCLLVCRNSFQKTLKYIKPHPQLVSDPNEYTSKSLHYLQDLIRSEKSRPFGSNRLEEIQLFVFELSPTKDEAKKLLDDYSMHFNKSLINDLSGLSNSYAKIADLCEPFIRFELVEPTYPHKLK